MIDDPIMVSVNNKLIEILRDCYLHQVITENTRARGTNIPSLLDLVLCYDECQIEKIEYHAPLGKSDHCVIAFLYNVTSEKCSYMVKRTFYEKGDYKAIKLMLNQIEWVKTLEGKNVQQQWDFFSEKIKECEEKYIPSKMVEIDGDVKYKENFPKHIITTIKKKRGMWKRYIETRLTKKYLLYCKTCTKVKKHGETFQKAKRKRYKCKYKK